MSPTTLLAIDAAPLPAGSAGSDEAGGGDTGDVGPVTYFVLVVLCDAPPVG